MKRKIPHVLKLYEALGCVGDSRLLLNTNSESTSLLSAKVLSSHRDKEYTVVYDSTSSAIMSDDNSSYRKDELGYPSIALLLFFDILDYRSEYGEALSGIKWKDLNTDNHNDRGLTQAQADKVVQAGGIDINLFRIYCDELITRLKEMNLNMLGEKKKPVQ